MALRRDPGRAVPSATWQTVEIPRRKMQASVAMPTAEMPTYVIGEDLQSAPSVDENVDSEPLQQLDDDSKYNIKFSLNGYPNVPNAIERPQLINRLKERLEKRPTDSRMTAFLIRRSGFGKTQLATDYAQRSQRKVYSAIFFVDAATESTLDRNMASILDQQLWAHWPDMDMARAETKPTDPVSTRSLVHQWLSQPENKRWLIIMDNVVDPDLILPYLPPKDVGHGTVIITTQLLDQFSNKDFLNANFPGYTEIIMVPGLEFEEGKKLLTRSKGSLADLSELGKTRCPTSH